ncbi:hypothetical protein R3P38DRAFT_517992 [Favolaschia claudopus]|uniref:Proteophosphoglycan ppg4 n=1 Tax=Favolaschia claudopus TaxID=2862362 RepID=A0AAV9ZBY5_9AGAR
MEASTSTTPATPPHRMTSPTTTPNSNASPATRRRYQQHRHTQSLGLLSPIPSRASLRSEEEEGPGSSSQIRSGVGREGEGGGEGEGNAIGSTSTPASSSRSRSRPTTPLRLPALLAGLSAFLPGRASGPSSPKVSSTPPPTLLPSHPHPHSQQQQQQPYSPSPSRSQLPHNHSIPSPQQQQPHAPQPRRAALFSPFAPMSASGSSEQMQTQTRLPRQTQTPPRPASASVFSNASSSTSAHTTPSRSEQLLRDALRRGSVGSGARPQGLSANSNSPLSRSGSTGTKGHGRGGHGHGRSWSVQIQGAGSLSASASPGEGGRQLKRQRHEDVIDGGGRGGVYGGDAEFSPSASGSRGYHSSSHSSSPAQVRLQQQRAGALAVLEGKQEDREGRERDPEHEALKARLERVLSSGGGAGDRASGRTSASGSTGTRSSLPGSDYSASSASSGGHAGRRMSFAANTSSTSAGVRPAPVSPNPNPNAHALAAERTMTTTPRPYTPAPKTPTPGSPRPREERTPTKTGMGMGMGRRGELEVGVGGEVRLFVCFLFSSRAFFFAVLAAFGGAGALCLSAAGTGSVCGIFETGWSADEDLGFSVSSRPVVPRPAPL